MGNSRKLTKSLAIETLVQDSERQNDGSLQVVYRIPESVTKDNKSIVCCTTCFSSFTGFSSATRVKLQNTVEEQNSFAVLSSTSTPDGSAGPLTTRCSESGDSRLMHCRVWMNGRFELLCNILPTSNDTAKDFHLPTCISKQSLYEEYKYAVQKMKTNHFHGPFSLSHFFRVWRDHFSYVTVPEHQSFSVCESCAQLHDRILIALKSHNEEALVQLCRLRTSHLKLVSQERGGYAWRQQFCIENPDKGVSWAIDGFDQAKSNIPHFAGGAFPKGELYFFKCSLFIKSQDDVVASS